MSGKEDWGKDPACFLQPLDESGVAVMRFSMQATGMVQQGWSTLLLRLSKKREYELHTGGGDYLPVPLCRPNITEIALYNGWLEDATRTVPYTAVLIFGLLVLTCGIICVSAALLSTMLSLRKNFREWRNTQIKIQSGSRSDRVAVNEFISKHTDLIEKQNRSFEVNIQMLMLQVTQIKEMNVVNPIRNFDLEAQLERATNIIQKSRDYCGFSHLMSLTQQSNSGVTLDHSTGQQSGSMVMGLRVPHPLTLPDPKERGHWSKARMTEDEEEILPLPDPEQLIFPEFPNFHAETVSTAFHSPLKLHSQVKAT